MTSHKRFFFSCWVFISVNNFDEYKFDFVNDFLTKPKMVKKEKKRVLQMEY